MSEITARCDVWRGWACIAPNGEDLAWRSLDQTREASLGGLLPGYWGGHRHARELWVEMQAKGWTCAQIEVRKVAS